MQDPIDDGYRVPVGGDGNFVADLTDDDGTILDSLVSSEAEPPERDELPVVRLDMRPLASKPIPAIQRMVVRTYTMAPRTPYLIATANPWRERILLSVDTGNATDVAFAPTSTEVLSSGSSYISRFNIYGDLNLEYNGELWAMLIDADPLPRLSVVEIISQEAGR